MHFALSIDHIWLSEIYWVCKANSSFVTNDFDLGDDIVLDFTKLTTLQSLHYEIVHSQHRWTKINK